MWLPLYYSGLPNLFKHCGTQSLQLRFILGGERHCSPGRTPLCRSGKCPSGCRKTHSGSYRSRCSSRVSWPGDSSHWSPGPPKGSTAGLTGIGTTTARRDKNDVGICSKPRDCDRRCGPRRVLRLCMALSERFRKGSRRRLRQSERSGFLQTSQIAEIVGRR